MSNKTPTEPVAATASAHNRKPLHLFLGLLLLGVGALALYSGIRSLTDGKQWLFTPNTRLEVQIADTPSLREQGLSGTEKLDERSGMLFVFDDVSIDRCFWMKDMNYPIDMIWLDEAKKVVHIERNVEPESYEREERFCPSKPAKYVLEINANMAASYGITDGATLRF